MAFQSLSEDKGRKMGQSHERQTAKALVFSTIHCLQNTLICNTIYKYLHSDAAGLRPDTAFVLCVTVPSEITVTKAVRP